jgi:hypothetical protein
MKISRLLSRNKDEIQIEEERNIMLAKTSQLSLEKKADTLNPVLLRTWKTNQQHPVAQRLHQQGTLSSKELPL